MARPGARPAHDPPTLADVAEEIAGPGEHPGEETKPFPFRAYNVVAVFEHGPTARKALEVAAETWGIGALSFVALHREGETCPCRPDTEAADAPGLATRVAARGAALGAAAGAALGAASTAVVPGLGPVVGAGLVVAALGGAGLGGATGGVVGAYAHLRDSEAGRSTYADVGQGRAVLAIHVDTAEQAARARRQLETCAPEATRVFDSHGCPVGR